MPHGGRHDACHDRDGRRGRGDSKKLNEAINDLARGDADLAKRKLAEAIYHYGEAWPKAVEAMPSA
jgi:hypothetical protein